MKNLMKVDEAKDAGKDVSGGRKGSLNTSTENGRDVVHV
jgi:hypothetical protein